MAYYSVLRLLQSWVVRDSDASHGPRLSMKPLPPQVMSRKTTSTVTSSDDRQGHFLVTRIVASRQHFGGRNRGLAG